MKISYSTVTVKLTKDIRELIFEELKRKSEKADDLETAEEIYSARGNWVLTFESCTNLLPWITKVDYDQSLLLWHIATELCYNTESSSAGAKTGSGSARKKDFRGTSKCLSDYMFYLLIAQKEMMSPVAGVWDLRFRDTYVEVTKLFDQKKIRKQKKQACEGILEFSAVAKPDGKGKGSKSVLLNACALAKELNKLGEERKWEIMSKVWVELLSYAACNCTATSHAAQLCKGGQLITLVWLLMAHFGLGNYFEMQEDTPEEA